MSAYHCVSTLFVLTVGVLVSVALEATGRQLKTYLIQRSSDRIDQHLSQLFFERALSLRMDGDRGRGHARFPDSGLRGGPAVHDLVLPVPVRGPAVCLHFFDLHVGPRGPIVIVPLTLLPVGILLGLALRGPIERYTALNVEESNRRNVFWSRRWTAQRP